MFTQWHKSFRSSFLGLTQSTDCGADSGGCCSAVDISATGHFLVTLVTLPDANTGALHGFFATEGARVLGVLRHFGLFCGLPQ